MFKEISVYSHLFDQEPDNVFKVEGIAVKIEAERITIHENNINKYYKLSDLPNKPSGRIDGFGCGKQLGWLYGGKWDVQHVVLTDEKLTKQKHFDLTGWREKYGRLGFLKQKLNHIVFSCEDGKHTLLVDLLGGVVRELDFPTDAVLLDHEQTGIVGYVSIDRKKGVIHTVFGKSNFSFKAKNLAHANAVRPMLLNDKIVYAYYHDIATGSDLVCYDLKTKKVAWQADVKQVMAEHSKYYNKVYLSAFELTVIMEGQEAYGSYLQLFDLNTGKRMFDYFPAKK